MKHLSLLFALLSLPALSFAQTGHVMNGVGPIDQSMSGAGMAAGIDALTELHWNPAGIVLTNGSELDVSLQIMKPTTTLSSSIEKDAIMPGYPGARMAGSSESESGVFPIPALGFVYHTPGARWAAGISAFGVGGFGVDYPSANPPSGNPITFPQANGGFGAVNSQFALFQVSPTVAYALTDKVSIGAAPTLNIGMLEVNPFPATNPTQQGYPDGPQSTTTGYGFQASLFAHDLNGFNAAVSFKSTQNFEPFEFESGSRTFSYDMDYPMILSAGLGYTGFDRLTLAADVRYLDFENTNGFQAAGFDQTGAVTGFGWKSIFVVAVGAQYELKEGLPIRIGYAYNENPIPDEAAFFNVASPAIVQHHISGGFSYELNDRFTLSAAVQYGPENGIQSNMYNPQMQPARMNGTLVRNELSTLTGIIGIGIAL